MQTKLNTLNRLLQWGVISSDSCILCTEGKSESHNHLFFDCSFSKSVWVAMLTKNQIGRDPLSWDKEKAWFIQHVKGKGFKTSIMKVSLAAAIYNIWCERNSRIFQLQALDSDSVISKISNAIRDTIVAWRNIKDSPENRRICRLWGVTHSIYRLPIRFFSLLFWFSPVLEFCFPGSWVVVFCWLF